MIVDDELVRISSANFTRRSMGMDSECDLAVEAGGEAQVRAGIRRIRDRLVAEHLGLAVDAVSVEIELHRIAVRADRCASGADRTLLPVEPVTDQVAEPSAVLRATVDPGEPLGFGPTAQMVPPVDATGSSPLRLWILPAIALLAVLVTSAAINTRPEFQAVREALQGAARSAVGSGSARRRLWWRACCSSRWNC